MRGDPLDVFHQRHRVLEDMVVDPLQYVVMRRTILTEGDAVGVVDVAAAIWDCLNKLAATSKWRATAPESGSLLMPRDFRDTFRS